MITRVKKKETNSYQKSMFSLKTAVYLMVGKIFCYIVKLQILQNHIHYIIQV